MRPAYSGLRVRGGNPTRTTPRNPIVCGRKFCAQCGRWRHVVDFQRERRNTGSGGLRSYCRTCSEIKRRTRMADARRRQELREYQRIWADARRRQAGVPIRNFKHRRSVIDRPERVLLPLEPLLQALVQVPETELDALARRAGLTPRTIYRYRHGESQHVRIDVADKLAVAMGTTSSLIWGEMW